MVSYLQNATPGTGIKNSGQLAGVLLCSCIFYQFLSSGGPKPVLSGAGYGQLIICCSNSGSYFDSSSFSKVTLHVVFVPFIVFSPGL